MALAVDLDKFNSADERSESSTCSCRCNDCGSTGHNGSESPPHGKRACSMGSSGEPATSLPRSCKRFLRELCAARGPELCMDAYTITDQIYDGFLGNKVVKAVHRRDGHTVVLKMYSIRILRSLRCLAFVRREVGIMKALDPHRNIVSLIGAFSEQGKIVLVLEHADRGDLFDARRQHHLMRFPGHEAVRIVRHVLQAVAFLHDQHIAHRDVKLENILLHGPEADIKLSDFGAAINTAREMAVTRIGTLDYVAPEVLRNPDKDKMGSDRAAYAYTVKVDVWAIGILTYELLLGSTPHMLCDDQAAPPYYPSWVPRAACEFIQACLQCDPDHRPTARKLLEHAWLRSA